jgi:hypothetical protein
VFVGLASIFIGLAYYFVFGFKDTQEDGDD